MLALLNYAFYAYYSRAIELGREVEEATPEELEIRVDYAHWEDASASLNVTRGRVLPSPPDSLSERDGLSLVVESEIAASITVTQAIPGETVELIHNGDFNESFSYWTVSPPAEWTIDEYLPGEYAALHRSSRRSLTARISQVVSLDSQPESVRISFSYRVYVEVRPWWWLRPIWSYKLALYVNDTLVKNIVNIPSRRTSYDSGWRSTGSIDLGQYLTSPGNYLIELRITAWWWGLGRVAFNTWIDKVSSRASYGYVIEEVEIPLAYDVEILVRFEDEEAYDSFAKLLCSSNASASCRSYYWNSSEGAWSLYGEFYYNLSDEVEWFNVTMRGPLARLYFRSDEPFELRLDYLEARALVLNDGEIYLYVKNVGAGEAVVEAVWVNETRNPESGLMDYWITQGEEVSIPVSLSELVYGRRYVVKVVTSKHVYALSFDT